MGSRSTPVVFENRLYTIVRHKPSTPEEGEAVVCADATTGKVLWKQPFNVYLSDVPDTRVGWSSCVVDPETGNVYALGVCGYFVCLDGKSGTPLWSHSLHEEYGLLSTYGGRTNLPLIVDDTVVVSAVVIGWGDTPKWGLLAKPAHRFMAFDKATGELRWLNGTRLIPYDTTYSTPTVALVDGQRQMIFGSGDGAIWSLQPTTGKQLWRFQFSQRGINSSPLVDGNHVFASHSEENWTGTAMGGLVALDASTLEPQQGSPVPSPEVLWRQYQVMVGKSSPVLFDGQLVVVEDGAKVRTYDPQTGKRVGRPPRVRGSAMRSTPLIADGKMYLTTHSGWAYILEPGPRGLKVVDEQRLADASCDASPIAAHGRVYVPSSNMLYCIGGQDAAAAGDQRVEPSQPIAAVADVTGPPAQLQVVPYEVLLKPGEKQSFRVRLFDQQGRLIETAESPEAVFAVDGPGSVDQHGLYQAPADAVHECALLKCRLGDLEGVARIRVVPPLPWHWDFDDLDDVPLTWVGGRVRYVLRDEPDGKVLVKRDLIPTRPEQREVVTPEGTKMETVMGTTKLGTRSQLWMGPTDLSDYTITADVQLTVLDGKLPDFGLINSRYTMALMGEHQTVRIYSWSTHDKRHQAQSEMTLEPGQWYTMKLEVRPRPDSALVRGKVWRRGDVEPESWNVTMVDTAPNLQGSPGLYGDTKNTELLIDNVAVTPNSEEP